VSPRAGTRVAEVAGAVEEIGVTVADGATAPRNAESGA